MIKSNNFENEEIRLIKSPKNNNKGEEINLDV